MTSYFDTEPLEFAIIKQQLADLAILPMTKESALNLDVSCDKDEVVAWQNETAESVALLKKRAHLNIGVNKDLRPLIKRLELGGMLLGAELVDLAYLMNSACTARRQISGRSDIAPALARLAANIGNLEGLVKNIQWALAENGDVKDSASRILGQLRQRVAKSYTRLIDQLASLIRKDRFRVALQSDSIANRNNRLCIEVKSEHRQVIPGIIHGISSTGATVFLEPLSVVRICNDWREFEAQVRSEEMKILQSLSGSLCAHFVEIDDAVNTLAKLDFIFAKGKLATKMSAIRPNVMTKHSEPFCDLREARHPLLGDNAVASDIKLGPDFRGMVITGPNAGGKTVALKTIGLLFLMHQAGLHIPVATESALKLFNKVLACIGDGQSIAGSVSTFSAHLTNLKSIIKKADKHSLVLLDELCSSTDPQEGAALACAILGDLVQRKSVVVATTHHARVTQFAANEKLFENASVDLDVGTFTPTYKLRMGIPGRSYALELAGNLDIPADIIAKSRQFLKEKQTQTDNLLTDIQKHQLESEQAARDAQAKKRAADQLHAEAEAKLAESEEYAKQLITQTQQELNNRTARVARRLKSINTKASKGKISDVEAAKRALERISGVANEPVWFPITTKSETTTAKSRKRKARATNNEPISQGDTVVISKLNKLGRVTAIKHNGTKAVVLMGSAYVEVDIDGLSLVKPNS